MEKSDRIPTLAGYDLAIARVKELHKERTGMEHGALAWLGRELGTSRQTIDNWSERLGFPSEYVGKVSEITGLKPEDIRPETVIVELPKSAWSAVPKRITNQAFMHTFKSFLAKKRRVK